MIQWLSDRRLFTHTGAMPAKAKRSKAPMSAQHKEALAVGREEGRAVRRYLEALEAHKPKRGRKRTADSIQRQLKSIEDKLDGVDSLQRVLLIQQRMDLKEELAGKEAVVDLTALEEDFVKAAKTYGKRKGISYAAWREAGVDAAVLRRAGIGRGAG
jgi:3-oxoacyl-ACP reductase-like protein